MTPGVFSAIRKSESEIRYRNIFERSRDIFYFTDKNGFFLEVNPSGIIFFGLSPEELLKANLFDFFNEKDQVWFRKAYNEKKDIFDREAIFNVSDRKQVNCMVTSLPYKSGDGKHYYQGIIHDNSHHNFIEDEKINSQKFSFSGRLARLIGHEIRNPLTNINLSVEQLYSEFRENPQAESCHTYFEIIKRNSDRINFLITELIESTRVYELDYSLIEIKLLINEVLEMCGDNLKLKAIPILNKINTSGIKISVDKEKMKLAIFNVIINLIDSMETGNGSLILRCGSNGNFCHINITGTASSLFTGNFKNIFEPFFNNRSKGRNLGLATSQNIIINHKGSINAYQEEPGVTTFQILIPFSS